MKSSDLDEFEGEISNFKVVYLLIENRCEAEGRVKRKSIKNYIYRCVQKCYTSSGGWYTHV